MIILKPANYGIAFCHIASVIATGIGVLRLATYWHGQPETGWFGWRTPMALSTSISVTLLGLSIFILTTLTDRHLKRCHPNHNS